MKVEPAMYTPCSCTQHEAAVWFSTGKQSLYLCRPCATELLQGLAKCLAVAP